MRLARSLELDAKHGGVLLQDCITQRKDVLASAAQRAPLDPPPRLRVRATHAGTMSGRACTRGRCPSLNL